MYLFYGCLSIKAVQNVPIETLENDVILKESVLFYRSAVIDSGPNIFSLVDTVTKSDNS